MGSRHMCCCCCLVDEPTPCVVLLLLLLLAVLSSFTSLRALSVMHPEGVPDLEAQEDDFDGEQIVEPPLLPGMGVAAAMPQPATATAAGGSDGSDASKRRSLPWWSLPKGLMSLCLSHMDITGRGLTQCGRQRQQCRSSSGGGCGCCLAPALAWGQQQQRQQLLLPGLTMGLSLFQSRPSPLRPLSKRRRQTQQRMGVGEGEGGEASGGAGGCSEDGSAAGGGAAAATAEGEGSGAESMALLASPQCSCVVALPSHFSSLQALWFEHVSWGCMARSGVRSVVVTKGDDGDMDAAQKLHMGSKCSRYATWL
jgi:hypothetical protein